MILTDGQRAVLEFNKNLDGGPASPQYKTLIRRNVKLKVHEALMQLEEVYTKFPEFRPVIQNGLKWFTNKNHGERGDKSKETVETKSALPDVDLASLPEWKPSEDAVEKAFKNV